MRDDRCWKLTEKERKEFLDKLKIAIDVAGGMGDDRWDDRSLDEVFSQLLPNGIKISFEITDYFPKKRKRKYVSLYKEFQQYVKQGGEDNVVAFLITKHDWIFHQTVQRKMRN